MSLGAADVSGTKITPRDSLKMSDFSTIWWVGDRADGGMVACCMTYALSTGGFQLKTSKNGKGQTTLEFTGHVSKSNYKVCPMTFYSADAEDAA